MAELPPEDVSSPDERRRIVVMPPKLASQIAAGEVVERPASAVKELVENAVDAGATRCDVEIEGGGIGRISVSDDGYGMTRDDALLAVQRHATSKLFSVEDLARVTTYGFRGEALPSIASVSRFSLRTRASGDDAGTLVEVEGGGKPSVHPVGIPVGTTVEIKDLFFNVAPRRKFLRSANTESGHVADVLEAAALARPDLTFTLSRDGRRVREWLRVETREERVSAILGEGLAAAGGQRGPLRVEAFLSRPEHARTGAGGLKFLVNGRPVRDRSLLHTIAQAYGSVLERGRYPRGVVYLDLPPSLVDVNVHPQKGEVRFADHRAVSDAVYQLLSTGLSRAFSLPSPPRTPWGQRAAPAPLPGTGPALPLPEVALEPPLDGSPADRAPAGDELSGAPAISDGDFDRRGDASTVLVASDSAAPILPSPAVRWASLRFVAQVRQTYLLCEGHEGFYVIDQHAAAERVNFDRLRKQYRSRTVPSQALLFPLTLQVSPVEADLVEARGGDFTALGIDVRPRGPDMVSVHTVPRLLTRASPERLVRDLLTELARTGRRAFSDAVDLALATMACHGSIRAGDPVSTSEASALFSALDSADFAGHCPHGRPVVSFTSWTELERKVGRR